MPYYRGNCERSRQRGERENYSETALVDTDLLAVPGKYGIGPENLRGAPLVNVEVLDQDRVIVVARKATLVLLTQGEGEDCEQAYATLEAGMPYTLTQASIQIEEHPEQILFWSSSWHEAVPY